MNKDTFSRRLRMLGSGVRNTVLLGDYNGYTSVSMFHCNVCGTDWESTPLNVITKKSRCPKCDVNNEIVGKYRRNGLNCLKSTEDFEKDFIESVGNKFDLVGTYLGSNRYVDIRCKKCGYEFQSKGYHIIKGDVGCPVCSCRLVVPGINSIKDTDPDIIEWLVDKDDALSYSRCSNDTINFCCPVCGRLFTETMVRVSGSSVICKCCKGGVSFPNKIIRNLIDMCKDQIDFYKSEWKIPKNRAKVGNNFRYDMYMIVQGNEYIIEMDGRQHYVLTSVIENDIVKERIAKNLNIGFIRIDSIISDLNYIKENILKSQLSSILDLNGVDWNKLELLCRVDELKKEILRLFNVGHSVIEIYSILNEKICTKDIRDFLMLANDNGKCRFRVVEYIGKWRSGKQKKRLYLDDNIKSCMCCKAVSASSNEVKYYLSKNLLRDDILCNARYKFDDGNVYKGYRLYTVSDLEMYENNKDIFKGVNNL